MGTHSRGVYTSRTVFSQVDRIRVEGLASVYRLRARTLATNSFDINGLLPLWAVGIPQQHANVLISHLTNPAEFWHANGTLCFRHKMRTSIRRVLKAASVSGRTGSR